MAEEDGPPPEPEKDRSERWLLTYADLITLLLIYFIICYSQSSVSIQKFVQTATSLNKAFSGTHYVVGKAAGAGAIPGGGTPGKTSVGPGSEQEQMEEIEENVEAAVHLEELEDEVQTSVGDEGVRIRLPEKMMFTTGRADLSAQALRVLTDLGKILAQAPGHAVRVEGHTDSMPMSSVLYPSNWELSSARASSVARALITGSGVDPKVLSVAGFADNKPIADNATPGGRSANRRVEIVILRNTSEPARGSASHVVPPAPTVAPAPPAVPAVPHR